MERRGIPAGVEDRLLDLDKNGSKLCSMRIQSVVFHLEEDLLEKEEEYLRLLRGDLDLLDPLLLLLEPLE